MMPDFQSVDFIVPDRKHFCVHSQANDSIDYHVRRGPTGNTALEFSDGGYASGYRRVLYTAMAGLFLFLAIIGTVIPGLPTTPFLLLTSFFLARSWPQMHELLLANRVFGPMLYHWQVHRALKRSTKIQATLFICTAMAMLVGFFDLPSRWLSFLLMLTSVGLFVVYRLPTLKEKTSWSECPADFRS